MLQLSAANPASSTSYGAPHLHNLASSKSGSGVELREWSSFIGIVTAIIGNIFISFALNVQRYAHIRIERELDESRSWKRGKRRLGGFRDYGTEQQVEIAQERARANLGTPPEENGNPTGPRQRNGHIEDDADETEPMEQSFQSDNTLASSDKSSESSYRKSYLRSPYWWLGIILMTVGETGNFLAYGFAPASIVSPLGVVALISNCVIAPIMLKERFRQRDFWGVLIAVAGAVTVVLSAKTSEEKMGPHDIWVSITRWEFELYLGITAAVIIGLMWASGKYGERSILIDLGLVGLFGNFLLAMTIISANSCLRRIHCALDQRRCLSPFRYSLAHTHLPNHIPTACHPCLYRSHANSLSQQSTSALRLYTSNSYTIRTVHTFSYHWQYCSVPRF
jgi:hypothetical protein